jgi:hypothetical protein
VSVERDRSPLETGTAPVLEPPSIIEPPRPAPTVPVPPLVGTRALLAASFEVVMRSQAAMRRASFYIGAVVLGTVGPLALASWASIVLTLDDPFLGEDVGAATAGGGLLVLLGALAIAGLLVAAVESRVLAVTLVGGAMVSRPVTTRQALARARSAFWRSVGASVLVAIPLTIVQTVVDQVTAPVLLAAPEVSLLTSTLVTALVGAPLAYTLAGVVLGDVDPWEALKRSIGVFRVRRTAAMLVVLFETIAALLILFGISAGLDLLIRVFLALGLGPEAGPLGQAFMVAAIVALVFAFGTLLFTVQALTVTPQVVMFLGLTHATYGLDRVEPGGADDPASRRPDRPRFRWFTPAMLTGFLLGAVGLGLVVLAYA